ncbi:MAG: hypothetical protein ACYC2H_11785 [Thermoplasmatota archaeon]
MQTTAWGPDVRLERLGWEPERGSGPIIGIDFTEEPPVLRATTFVSETDMAAAVRPFLQAIAAPDADIEGYLERLVANGDGRFFAEYADFGMGLEGAFHPQTSEHPVRGAALMRDGPLVWGFSFPNQQAGVEGRFTVQTDSSDHLFVEVAENPDNDGDARVLAAQELAHYSLVAAIGLDFRFDVAMVCT